MKIVKLHGGLANQMFQYAFYLSLKKLFPDVFIDSLTFKPNWGFDSCRLEDVFSNVRYIEKTHIESRSLLNILRKKCRFPSKRYVYEMSMKYSEYYLSNVKGFYYEGYWQSELYFSQNRNELLNVFNFKAIVDPHLLSLIENINVPNSVAVHVRKGKDYSRNKLINGTCDVDYFKRAVHHIDSMVVNPVYFVFSDNFDWVDEHLSFFSFTKVQVADNLTDPSIDMNLMSRCAHNIISNSSFSWWSAWLNLNIDKIVIAPDMWFNSASPRFDSSTIVPDTWIKL